MVFFLRHPSGLVLGAEFSAESIPLAILAEEASGAPEGTRLVALETDAVHAIANESGGWTITASWQF